MCFLHYHMCDVVIHYSWCVDVLQDKMPNNRILQTPDNSYEIVAASDNLEIKVVN